MAGDFSQNSQRRGSFLQRIEQELAPFLVILRATQPNPLTMRIPSLFSFGEANLPANLLLRLKKLEWELTCPYGKATSTPTPPTAAPLAPLIAEIPARYRHALMTRPLHFFDDGMTTFDMEAENEYKWRADAIQAVTQCYWNAVQEGWKMYPVTAERRADLIKQMRKHWYQDNFAKLPK